MKCPKCDKPIKENMDGDSHYCQGHSFFGEPELTKKELKDAGDKLVNAISAGRLDKFLG